MASILFKFIIALLVHIVVGQGSVTKCGDNEESTCGSVCIETCSYKPQICIEICKIGCFCKEGYVRESNATGSHCIKREECHPIDVHQCGQNEEFLTCGSTCPPTCDDWSYPLPKPPKRCLKMCKQGCFCKKGLYRTKENTCVKPEQCCGNNEAFTNCGPACVETCYKKPEICTEQCVAGCFCQQNHVRANNATASLCIRRNQCSN